ncbi:Uncharacterised protein [Vibrio cholerae]|nr:Uncharacterised protein [Vibrio cholerae]
MSWIEAQYAIRVPTAMADKATKHPTEACKLIQGIGLIGSNGLQNALLELWSHSLIGIQPQHIIRLDIRLCQLALRAKARPLCIHVKIFSVTTRDLLGFIVTARIEHYDLINPVVHGL